MPFEDLFKDVVLQRHQLPVNENDATKMEIKKIYLLYSDAECHTVNVSWTIGETPYTITINVERIDNQWRVTGIKRKDLRL